MTHWDGRPTPARRVLVEVGPPDRPLHWARSLQGQLRWAVEVVYAGRRFYLDDAYGQGWLKVTERRGLPSYGHRELPVQRVFEEYASAPRFSYDLECVPA